LIVETAYSVKKIVATFIDTTKESHLPISRQADLLGIARSSVYYDPVRVSPKTLVVMKAIDELYTKHPFYGSRKIAHGVGINRKQAQRLMRLMDIEAVYAKPNLSKPNPAHSVYPYLLRGVTACRPNHVWGTDITYIRLTTGFAYLTAFIDWYSRFILSWKLSTTLEAAFCIEAANEALTRYGMPDITNSDQGCQYTSNEYIALWKEHKTHISMDGRGRAMDNIFIERFWRTIKYEEVYLKEYESVRDAERQIGAYIAFYNTERPHQSLDYQTPATLYFPKQKIGLRADIQNEKIVVLNSCLQLS
jgi:putative transposase